MGDLYVSWTDYNRIAAVHWKDSKSTYRGYTGPTPTRESHEKEILYKDLGANGVDHGGAGIAVAAGHAYLD